MSKSSTSTWRGRIARGIAAVVLALAMAAAVLAESLEEAAERVAREYDAKVVSAREVERNGQRVYVIRILTRDGVVRTVRVPAGDGP